MSNIVPYTFDSDIVPERSGHAVPNMTFGVHIILDPNALEPTLERLNFWFEDRTDVFLVDSGHTQKNEDGFIILEWEGFLIDPLFLKILQHDDAVLDFTLYQYGEEGA